MRMLQLTPSRLALALALAAGLGACDSSSALEPTQGQVVVPLTTTIGTDVYRLAPAQFEVSGPGGTMVLDASSQPSLTVELPPGLTTVLLRPGWSLGRSTDGGHNFQPVSALLGSSNPLALRVLANTETTVAFDFLVRNPNGTVTVSFGVDPSPHQLAGGFNVTTATGALAGYAAKRLDFSSYFTVTAQSHRVEADGSKSLVYTVGGNATEFYNDPIGTLATTIGPAFAGGYLEYRVTAKADGTQEIYGEYYGAADPYPTFIIGPGPLSNNLQLDAAGFPIDAYFHSVAPFTLTAFVSGVDSSLTGRLILRNLLP